jgi:uncharacterized protein (DUF1778 family)
MPSITASKSARLETRITPELQQQLRRVAEIQGRSLSDYLTAALHAAVQRDLEEIATVRLTREASEQFARALIDPPEPSPALQRAFEVHRSLVRYS